MGRKICTSKAQSDCSMDIWPGAWRKVLPKVSQLYRNEVPRGAVFAFVVVLFLIPSHFEWWQGRAREPGRVEVLRQCLPGAFLSRRQRDACWAIQQQYKEADPSSPVSTPLAPWEKEMGARPQSYILQALPPTQVF